MSGIENERHGMNFRRLDYQPEFKECEQGADFVSNVDGSEQDFHDGWLARYRG